MIMTNRKWSAIEIMAITVGLLFTMDVLASIHYVVTGLASPVPIFETTLNNRKSVPSNKEGVDIELPNFDVLFRTIQQVSPLARQVIQRDKNGNFGRGFDSIDYSGNATLRDAL